MLVMTPHLCQCGDLDRETLPFRNISRRFDQEPKTPNNAPTQFSPTPLSLTQWPNTNKKVLR